MRWAVLRDAGGSWCPAAIELIADRGIEALTLAVILVIVDLWAPCRGNGWGLMIVQATAPGTPGRPKRPAARPGGARARMSRASTSKGEPCVLGLRSLPLWRRP
jgi:hypothetical protein